MNAWALLDTLEGLGVSVTATSGGRVRLEPASRVHPSLLDEVRASKAALLEVLAPRPRGDMLPPLPWEVTPAASPTPLPAGPAPVLDPLPDHLAALVSAARAGEVRRSSVMLASGLVPDLSVYVLAWAEAWPHDRAHVLRRLEEAHAVTVRV